MLKKVWLILSDTTSLNTGCVQGINVRVVTHIFEEFKHELLLGNLIKKVEGKSKGPGAWPAASAYNKIGKIGNPEKTRLRPLSQLKLRKTPGAKEALRQKLEYCATKKIEGASHL